MRSDWRRGGFDAGEGRDGTLATRTQETPTMRVTQALVRMSELGPGRRAGIGGPTLNVIAAVLRWAASSSGTVGGPAPMFAASHRPTEGRLQGQQTGEGCVCFCVFPLGHLRLRPPAQQSTDVDRCAGGSGHEGLTGDESGPGPPNHETSFATAPESCSTRVEQGSGRRRERRVGRC
jgi:hypothetical protein